MWPWRRKKIKKSSASFRPKTQSSEHTQPSTPIDRPPIGTPLNSYLSDLQAAMLPFNTADNQRIKDWIESGGDVHWATESGMTLLHYAAMKGNLDMTKYLLSKGAKVNARTKNNETALLWACANVEPEVVPILLEHGADPNIESEGDTPLKLMRQSGLPQAKAMVKLMLEKGARTKVGVTAECDECGSPEPKKMSQRNVNVTIEGAVADVKCHKCPAILEIHIEKIDRTRGIRVQCPPCQCIMFIPPSVWCKTCGEGLSTGWSDSVTVV